MTSRSVLLEAKQLGKQFKTGSGTLDLFVNLNLTINAGETLSLIHI